MNKTLIYVLLFLSYSLSAQIDIKGRVIDEITQEPIEFAEIALTSENTSMLSGAVTDEKGFFSVNLKNGKYQLKIIYVGEVIYTKEIELTENIDLGVISAKNSQQLDEVVILAKKKLIERKIDRLVFNVENSTSASGGDALEVLRVTPGVAVRNDKITIVGKSGLSVMINDKIVQLPDDELSNFLKSISSEDIKNIEVITTPPAKYEASGNSGLVNIILKKSKKDSWNAQIKSKYRQRRYPGGNVGGSFNFNKNKISIATSVNYRDEIYYQEQDDYAYFSDGLWYTSSPFKLGIQGLNAKIDLDYEISSNWTMGGQYLYNKINYDLSETPYTPVFDYNTDEIIRSLNTIGKTTANPEIHSVNYNNKIAFDSLGKNIELNLDYFKYNKPDVKTYNGVSVIENPFSQQFYRGINTNEQDVSNISAKLDIEYPTKWINLSLGGKLTVSESENNIFFFNSGLVNQPVAELPITKNDFKYNEDIQAFYFSADKKINKKWSVQLGVRMENTQTNSKSNSLNLDVDNDYTKFFPTVYVSFDVTENSNFGFNYSRRIERPSFYQLNPNMYFANPFQTIEGNPFLQPAFIDNIELSNTYKSFTTKFYFSYEDNMFSQVPLPDSSTNIIRFTEENFINTQRFGISEDYTFDKINWWSSNNSFDINYSKSEFSLEEEQENQEGINARISTYNDINLNPSKTLLLGVNYWYSFPGVNGIFDAKSASSLSLSLQYFLLNKNLNIALNANDIFRSSADRTTTTINGVFQEARYYYDSQFIQLSFSYKLGNEDIKVKKHKTGNSDEKGRTGN